MYKNIYKSHSIKQKKVWAKKIEGKKHKYEKEENET